MEKAHWKREADFFDAQAERRGEALSPIDPRALDRYSSPSLRRRFAREFRLRTVGDLRGKSVLDVGCGEGSDTVLLALLGAARVTGVDLSPKAIALARRRAAINGVADRVALVCGPVETAELPDGGFDVVWCNSILHHLTDDLDRVMRTLVRWTRAGGLLSFCEPVARSRTLRKARLLIPIRSGDCTPDERPLEPRDLAILRRHLPDLTLRHFGLLGRIDRFVLTRWNYERSSLLRRGVVNVTGAADWLLLSLPLLDRLGSLSVMWGRRPLVE